ncbi:MAG: glycolate oxidase subunit GlcE [Gammaproteobacteria bacterium]|nr:glycolate oxidase subunit GlcE [Gammaproteobacteria bacterium]
MNADQTDALINTVRAAIAARRALRIIGGNTKAFLGRATGIADTLSTAGHRGIINYEPQELVITARAGTPVLEIETALAQHGQMLAFEPPHYGDHATLGGTIACNLSGPRRPYAGAARDFVLGVEIINGHGDRLRFGGQVMKNVAGYDVARLMTGAYGTLGVLLNVTLKVLPRAVASLTVHHETSLTAAIEQMNIWAGQPLPITATAFDGAGLSTRLEGTETAVRAARLKLGGELETREDYWLSVREHTHGFFHDTRPLWRLALPPASAPLALNGKYFVEWNGALRWLYSDTTAEQVRAAALQHGGHATLLRAQQRNEAFHPLPAPLAQLHRKVKAAFDPHAIFNPGRLYAEF